VIAFVISAPAVSQRGLVIEQKRVHAIRTMVGMVTQDDDVSLTLAPGGTRIESKPPGSPTIFRFETNGAVTLIEANGLRKTYRSEDLEERRRVNEELQRALAKRATPPAGGGGLLSGLASLSQQSRQSGTKNAPVTAKPMPKKRTIAGRRCRGVEFYQDDDKIFEAWYTEKPAPKWMKRYDLQESPGAENAALLEARLKQTGIELESTMPLGAGGRFEVRTMSVKERLLPASTFKAPAGYRKVAPPRGAQR
jgi:hypothetical protein